MPPLLRPGRWPLAACSTAAANPGGIATSRYGAAQRETMAVTSGRQSEEPSMAWQQMFGGGRLGSGELSGGLHLWHTGHQHNIAYTVYQVRTHRVDASPTHRAPGRHRTKTHCVSGTDTPCGRHRRSVPAAVPSHAAKTQCLVRYAHLQLTIWRPWTGCFPVGDRRHHPFAGGEHGLSAAWDQWAGLEGVTRELTLAPIEPTDRQGRCRGGGAH